MFAYSLLPLRGTHWEALLLVVGVVHVLLYALLVPPWYHYDEPASLEYALLIRDLGRVPAYDEQIPALRAAIARSMQATDLFATQSAATPPAAERVVGFNQRVHPPLYYALIALITLPARHYPIEIQLLIGRLGSTMLAALCLYLAVRVLRLLLPVPGPRLFTLFVLVLLPPFADIMSALNSDVLANTVAVGLLWLAVAWLSRPRSGWLILSTPLLLALALAAKRSVALAGLVLLVLVIFLRSSLRLRLISLGVLVLAGAATGVGFALLPCRPTAWTPRPAEARLLQVHPAARSGDALFALERPAAGAGATLEQELAAGAYRDASGQFLTLSGWMRADHPQTMALSPGLQVDTTLVQDTVLLGTEWTAISISAYVPPDVAFLAVRLHGPFEPGTVFYDDLSLVIDSAPAIDLRDGLFEPELLGPGEPANVLRNAGAERCIPDIQMLTPAPLDHLLARPTIRLALNRIFDPAWQLAAYPRQLLTLFAGFWGTFSWGEAGVPTSWLLSIGLLVGAAIAGALRFSLNLAAGKPSDPLATPTLWWLCLGLCGLVWAVAVGRVLLQPVPGRLILGFGRYTFPAVLPSLIVFSVGLQHLVPAPLRRQVVVGTGGFLAIYTVVALFVALPT